MCLIRRPEAEENLLSDTFAGVVNFGELSVEGSALCSAKHERKVKI